MVPHIAPSERAGASRAHTASPPRLLYSADVCETWMRSCAALPPARYCVVCVESDAHSALPWQTVRRIRPTAKMTQDLSGTEELELAKTALEFTWRGSYFGCGMTRCGTHHSSTPPIQCGLQILFPTVHDAGSATARDVAVAASCAVDRGRTGGVRSRNALDIWRAPHEHCPLQPDGPVI